MAGNNELNCGNDDHPLISVAIRNSGDNAPEEIVCLAGAPNTKADDASFLDESSTQLQEQIAEPTEHDSRLYLGRFPAVGDYALIRQIGHGGFGRVFEGYHRDNPERRVAIKIYESRRLDDVRRLEIERIVLQKLCHPGLVASLDSGKDADGRIFLVMSLIDGIRIDRFVDEHKPDFHQIA